MEHPDSHRQAGPDASRTPEPSASLLPGVLGRLAARAPYLAGEMPLSDLVAALGDPRWEVRAAAVRALGLFQAHVTIAPVIATLQDEHRLVRAAAVRAVGHMGDQMPLDQLVVALRDRDWEVREMAVLVLGGVDTSAALPLLGAALQDVHGTVRAAAAATLERHGARLQQPLAIVSAAQPAAYPVAPRPHLHWGRRPARRGLRRTSLAAALVSCVLVGLAGYLRLGTPTTVSAQTVLRRAADLHLAPGKAVHFIYHIAVAGGATGTQMAGGTADVWVRADAHGRPILSVQTLTVDTAHLALREVQSGPHVFVYDAAQGTIQVDAQASAAGMLSPDAFISPSLAKRLSVLAQRSLRRGSQPQIQARPQQTLAGRTVDVIVVARWPNRSSQQTTLYFDAQSYVLRGFDGAIAAPSAATSTRAWQARLVAGQTLETTAVPPHTFTLNAPGTARVVAPPLPDAAAFARMCRSSASIKDILRAGTSSLLAACRATAPHVTADALVAALAAPGTSALAVAEAMGEITRQQEITGVAALRARITELVTRPAKRAGVDRRRARARSRAGIGVSTARPGQATTSDARTW